ncbi:MAG: SpoIIE family protein phosphatase [Nitrospiraceae bacterium]
MNAQLIEWGVASLTMPGQSQSGDRHLVQPYTNGVLVAVVDGLGHGERAAAAADLAVTTLSKHAHESAIALYKRCHDDLRETRGVVMSLASFNELDGTLTWMGIGNVEGLVLRAEGSPHSRHEYLLLRSGVVGSQLPSLSASIMPMMQGDTLIFVTDGIRSGFAKGLSTGDPPQRMANRILAEYSKGSDDALVLVARYLK